MPLADTSVYSRYTLLVYVWIGHMTLVLLALRSTSSATGNTVGIYGLRYRGFTCIAIMRDKKKLSLWKTHTQNTGEDGRKQCSESNQRTGTSVKVEAGKWDTFWQKLPAVMATIRISSYLAEEKLKGATKARERNKHDMSWEENTRDKNRRRKSHF